ncbi:MAG TPA: sugar phosphate isomerase/epimerase family protein [Paracoccaceae bacterium]|nr:sugar phosphate isomerase/epimerase family protein [Paracoccaceae bacterium]
MISLGVHAFCVARDWNPREWRALLPGLVGQGVSVIEVPLLRPEEMEAEASRALAEEYGMELVCSLGLPGRLDPVEDPGSALAFLAGALEVAARAGANALSGVTYGTIGKTSGAPPTARELDGIARYLVRAAAEAKARGLRLGIEPCNRYETHLMNSGAEARAMIERVGADNLFIHVDTYHMAIEEAGFEQGFRDCGPFLGYVHASESNRGVPGRGMIDWDAVFAGLAAAGYCGPVTLESFVFVDQDIARGLALWRPVAERPKAVIAEGLPFLREVAERHGLVWDRAAAI